MYVITIMGAPPSGTKSFRYLERGNSEMGQPPAELQLTPLPSPDRCPDMGGAWMWAGVPCPGGPTGVGVWTWVEAAAHYGPHAEDVFHFNWGVGLSGQE